MLKKFLKSFCLTTTAFAVISSSAFATTGKVIGNKVRIREKADTSSPEVSVATKNETVEIIGEEGNWYKVNFEKVTGYISKDYVETNYSSESTGTTLPTESGENVTQVPENSSELQAQATNETVTNTVVSNEAQNTSSENPEQSITSEENSESDSEEQNNNVEENTQNYQEGQTVIFKQETSLRYLPNFASRELVKVEKDSSYTVMAVLNNWLKVTNDTNSGWVLKTNIEETSLEDNSNNTTEATPNSTETIRKGVVNVESAKLRKDPDGESLDTVKDGTEVTILGEEGDWYNISVGEYDNCYIAKRLITEK